MRRFIKKLSLAILLLATVTSMLFSLSSCAFLLPKILDKLPDEEIIKIEKVTEISYDNVVYQELSEENIVPFKEYLQELRYRKWVNLRGVKCAPRDFVWLLITYENYTVQLGETNFIVRTRDENKVKDSFIMDMLYPEDTLAKMFALFEN